MSTRPAAAKSKFRVIESQQSGNADSSARIVPLPNRPACSIDFDAGTIIRLRASGGVDCYAPLPNVVCREECADGEPKQRQTYRVRIGDVEASLTTADLLDEGWIDRFPDLGGVSDKPVRTLYADVIRFLGSNERVAEVVRTRKRTGFHEEIIDGNKIYGYLAPDAFIAGKTHWPYPLVWRGTEGQQLRSPISIPPAKAVRDFIIEVLKISPDGQLLICIIAQVCSVLNYIRPENYQAGFLLFLYGEPGSGKTSIASAARSGYYPAYDYRAFDFSFRNTQTSLEIALDKLRHIPCVIDDLRQGTSEPPAEFARKLKALIDISHAAYDRRQIRGRANRNLEEGQSNYIKTIPMATSEVMPQTDDSFYRRIIALKLERGAVAMCSAGQKLGLDHISKRHSLLKSIYYACAETVIDALNEGKSAELGNSLVDWAMEHKRELHHDLAQTIGASEQDYRENLCLNAAHLIASARFLDDLFKTQGYFRDALSLPLFKALEAQLSSLSRRNGHSITENLAEKMLTALFEGLADGVRHEGQFVNIPVIEGASSTEGRHGLDELLDENAIGYRAERKPRVAVGCVDVEKNRAIFPEILIRKLRDILSEWQGRPAHSPVSLGEVFEVFEKAGFIARKPHTQLSSQHRVTGTDIRVKGWHLYADKVLRVHRGEDDGGEQESN